MTMPKKKKREITLSVHQLVDFLLREGDIDNRIYNQETMRLGSKLHAAFQEKQGRDYLSEVPLKQSIEREKATVILEGRADGIIVGGPFPVIDEIKSTVMPLEQFYAEQKQWHLGQAKCYAYLYLKEQNLEKCGIRLTYLSQVHSDEKMVKERIFSFRELEKDIFKLIDSYLEMNEWEFEHLSQRNESVKKLPFPYDAFRAGQRDMAKYIYSVANKGGIFFCEAPTGIGKTISALYPAIKSFSKGDNSRIFYLTAKTSGRNSAYDALSECYRQGYVGRDSLLTAKEKLCFCPGKNCNPDECPFAKGYYGKLRKVIQQELKNSRRYDVQTIKEIAESNAMCPFELQLDLSLLSDVIVCDYNYFFDPLVRLERYFDPSVDASHNVILIDEAHNLPSRARDMYSEILSEKAIESAKNDLSHVKARAIKNALGKLQKSFEECKSYHEEETFHRFSALPESFLKAVDRFVEASRDKGKEDQPKLPDSVKKLARACYRFSFLHENYPANAVYYGLLQPDDYEIHLQSLDPSPWIKDSLSRVKGAAIFSATLSPISYYMESILGASDYPFLALPSPFPKENFNLMIAPKVSTRYKNRDKTYQEVADYLTKFVSGKKGNYFLYLPSYDYLSKIAPLLHFEDADIYIQERDMSDSEKDLFLSRFLPNPKKTTIGLLIIGGSFSEGIDLLADRLIGVAVVGIGLPQISQEVDLIRDYYEKKNGKGFEYAYMNPGMNKVMQAVGRLIRSETDVGSALLIDERYAQNDYRCLFERAWNGYEVVLSPDEVEENLLSFYRRKRE